jgi:hypothetical protein
MAEAKWREAALLVLDGSEGEPYRMGRDCAINGPNTTNCNFRLFSSRDKTNEWERGKRDAFKRRQA